MLNSQEMTDITRAAKLVLEEGHSCAFCCGQKLYTSNQRGVVPLIHFLSEGICFKAAYVANKVIGKAAALLLVLAGIKGAYESGLYILSYYGIMTSYDTCVPTILNRAGTEPRPWKKQWIQSKIRHTP